MQSRTSRKTSPGPSPPTSTESFPSTPSPKTVQYAIEGDLADARRRDIERGEEASTFYGLFPDVARTLDWLIRHNPRMAAYVVGELVGNAERDLHIPRSVTRRTLQTALNLDGELDGTPFKTSSHGSSSNKESI
jgi:hypothetical protein